MKCKTQLKFNPNLKNNMIKHSQYVQHDRKMFFPIPKLKRYIVSNV